MYIKSATLKNFRSHANTVLQLARLTVIRGENASGKSSLEQGIELALANHAEGTDAAGRGAAELIRMGEKKAMIELDVEHAGSSRHIACAIAASTGRSILVSDPSDPQWDGGAKSADWLKSNRQVLSCLCNNRYFVDLASDAQKDILAAIVLPESYAWPEWVKPMAGSFGLSVDWTASTFDIIQQGYDLAYEKRTEVNRDAKKHVIPTGDVSESDNVDEYKSLLATREKELEALIAGAAAKGATVGGNEQARALAISRKTEAEARIAADSRIVAEADEKLLSPAKLKELEKAAKGAEKAKGLDAEMLVLNEQITILRMERKKLESLGEKPECPTCGTAITPELLAKIYKPVADEIDEKKRIYDSKAEERKSLGNPEEAQKKVDAHKQAALDMERAKQRIQDDQVIVRDAETKLETLPASPASTLVDTEHDNAVVDLRGRIQKGKQAVAAAEAALRLRNEITAAKAKRDVLLKQQGDIEKLVKYFGEEVRAELLTAGIVEFTVKMNQALASWGYECDITIDPYVFSLKVNDGTGKGQIALKNLSKSQRYRFSVAFQVALAVTTGFGFLIVDEADIFDSKGRAGLFEALYDNPDIEQAIILATDERTEIPDIDGAVFYRFEDVSTGIPTTTVTKLLSEGVSA